LNVWTQGDPHAIMRQLLRSIDPELPLYQAGTLSEEITRSFWQERLLVALTSCFGGFALLSPPFDCPDFWHISSLADRAKSERASRASSHHPEFRS
jgi:hypothetical protein